MLSRKAASDTVENFFNAFKRLRRKEKNAVFERIIRDRRMREELEDLFDLAISMERMKQPSRVLEDVLREIDASRVKLRGLSR